MAVAGIRWVGFRAARRGPGSQATRQEEVELGVPPEGLQGPRVGRQRSSNRGPRSVLLGPQARVGSMELSPRPRGVLMSRPSLVLVPQHFGSLLFDRRSSRYMPFDPPAARLLRQLTLAS